MFCNVLCLYSSTFVISIFPLFKFSIFLKTLSASISPTLEKYCCIFIVFEKYTNLSSQRSPATGIPKETLVIHECSLAPKTMSKLQTNSNSSLAVFGAGKSFSSGTIAQVVQTEYYYLFHVSKSEYLLVLVYFNHGAEYEEVCRGCYLYIFHRSFYQSELISIMAHHSAAVNEIEPSF